MIERRKRQYVRLRGRHKYIMEVFEPRGDLDRWLYRRRFLRSILPAYSFLHDARDLKPDGDNAVGAETRLQPIGVKPMQPHLKQVNATGSRRRIHT